MQNYSDDPSSVRVDFFKESGKWYTTEAVKWIGYFSPGSKHLPEGEKGVLIDDAFEAALRQHLTQPDGRIRLAGMWAVCLSPYHEHSHPFMMRVPER